jgi:ribosome-associated protein
MVKALDEKKGLAIHLLDMREVVSYTDYVIICSATSVTHTNALIDNVEDQSRPEMKPIYRNSAKDKNWMILDYGEVVVHVFNETARAYYDLERLWGDAKRVDLSKVLS